MCALVYFYKRAAQKTADSGTSRRRREGEVLTSRGSADGAAMAPRYLLADASKLSRWFLDYDYAALAHRCCRAGARRHRRAGAMLQALV
jgi:hypothetical protein